MADFSGDRTTKVERVVSPFDGIDGRETAAQREVREALMSRQITLAPDAAKDGLGKESAMSQMTANAAADKKAADAILNNGATVVGATDLDKNFKPQQLLNNKDVLDVVDGKTGNFTKRTRGDGLAVA